MFSEGCRSVDPTSSWLASKRLPLRKKPRRAVDTDVVVDACPCVGELWELEAGVPEHRHRRPRALRLKLNMEKPSKTYLSRTSPCHPHLTWWK
jgi:hypothetical protein